MKLKYEVPIILLSILLCVIFFSFIFHSFYWAPFPYEIDQGEGFNIEISSWGLNGRPLYLSQADYPFVRSPYPPIFYWFCIPSILIFGKKIIAGRIISIIFTFLTGFCIYRIVSRRAEASDGVTEKKKWDLRFAAPGLIAAGLFFSCQYVFWWGPLARVDMTANYFSILALYVISKNEKNKNLILAALIAFIAFFTKLQSISAILAIILYLLIKDRKKGLQFLAVFIPFTAVVFIIFNVINSGNFIFNINPFNNMGTFSIDRFMGFTSDAIQVNYIPILISLVFIFFMKGDLIYKLFFLCCIPFLVTLGGNGSCDNHLVSIFTAIPILVGLFLARMFQKPEHFQRNLVASFLLFYLIFPNRTFHYLDFKQRDLDPWLSRQTFDKITSYVRESPGDVLTEYASFAFLAGKQVLIHPLVVIPMFRVREADISKLLADCNARRFSCIVRRMSWESIFGLSCYENYYLADILIEPREGRPWFIMKPRQPPQPEITDGSVEYLSDITPLSAKQDWGVLALDKSALGMKITAGDKLYAKGLGTHANSEIVYNVEGYKEFKAVVGIDGEMTREYPNYASVIFKVYLDDKIAFESPISYQLTPAQEINIPINDSKLLKLVVTDAGKGSPDGYLISEDHADWADARLIRLVPQPEAVDNSSVYLSDLTPTSARQDWGTLAKDKSALGRKITVGNRAFRKGLGTHANSEIVYDNVGGYKEFKAIIGIDGAMSVQNPSYASVIFKVYLDDKLAFESPVFYQATPPEQISIPVNNSKVLKLVVTDAGKGSPDGLLISEDHADWADAKLTK